MNRLIRKRVMKKFLAGFTVVFLVLLGMTIFNGVMISQAAEKEDEVCEVPSAIRFTDKFLDACMTESGKVWVVGHVGTIVYSDNFGKDWKKLNSPTERSIFGVDFVTPTMGWICGEVGTLYKTEDGGETWQIQNSGTMENHLLLVRFYDENIGYAMGARGYIVRTDDSGKTWKRLPFDEDLAINDIHILNENVAWAACEFDQVIYTEDGGQHWTFQREKGGIGNLFGISFIDENRGVAVGTEGRIYYTENGGQEWKDAENNQRYKKTMMKVKLFKNNKGIAVGLDGSMLLTKDGGLSWDDAKAVSYYNWFSGLSAIENGKGIAVGGGGTIAITKDYGVSWE